MNYTILIRDAQGKTVMSVGHDSFNATIIAVGKYKDMGFPLTIWKRN